MNVLGVDRVILATHDLEATTDQFEDLLGLSFGSLLQPTTATDAGSQDVQNVISSAGVELVAPRSDDGELNRFLEENGPGLYALSLRVTDLEAAIKELAEKGVESVGEYRERDFAEAFFHPRHFGGVMLILAEYDAPHPAETASLERRGND